MTLGNEQIFLKDDKIPVSRYVYKLIHNLETHECKVFILYNNPFATLKSFLLDVSTVFAIDIENTEGFRAENGFYFEMPSEEFFIFLRRYNEERLFYFFSMMLLDISLRKI